MCVFMKKINTIKKNVFHLFWTLFFLIFAPTTASFKGVELQPNIVYNHLQASGNLLICRPHMADDRGKSCLAHKLRDSRIYIWEIYMGDIYIYIRPCLIFYLTKAHSLLSPFWSKNHTQSKKKSKN